MRHTALAVPVALGAAAAYAAASALQHVEARRSSAGDAVALRGMVRLLGRPLWLVGCLADVLGLVLHVLALGLGPVSLVQPIQVTGLLFAIPFGGALNGQRARRRDLLAALAVVAGLALFLGVARPTPTALMLTGRSAAVLGGLTVLGLGVGALAGRVLQAPRRAVLLAGLAGSSFAVGSVLLEDLGRLQHAHGWPAVVTGPGLPALLSVVVLGTTGLVMSQAAFQIGTLGQALPVLTVTDPVISIALAALLFRETFALTGYGIVLDLVSLTLVTVGVTGLAHREPHVDSQPVPRPPAAIGRVVGRREVAALLRRTAPRTGTWWGAACVAGSYGLLPGLVGVVAMSRVDLDTSASSRTLVLLAGVTVSASTGVIQFHRSRARLNSRRTHPTLKLSPVSHTTARPADGYRAAHSGGRGMYASTRQSEHHGRTDTVRTRSGEVRSTSSQTSSSWQALTNAAKHQVATPGRGRLSPPLDRLHGLHGRGGTSRHHRLLDGDAKGKGVTNSLAPVCESVMSAIRTVIKEMTWPLQRTCTKYWTRLMKIAPSKIYWLHP